MWSAFFGRGVNWVHVQEHVCHIGILKVSTEKDLA